MITSEARRETTTMMMDSEAPVAWTISWGSVWVGALTGLAAILLFGLIGMALGAHKVGTDARIVHWSDFGFWPLAFSVLSTFFAFVGAGWVAAKISGHQHSENAMLHGALAWLFCVPMV